MTKLQTLVEGGFVLVAVLLLVSMVTSCAEVQAVKTGVASHGAKAADEALEVAKWQTCQSASIGSLERDLGGDRERIAGWILWCGKKPSNSPLMVTEPSPIAQPQSGVLPETRMNRAIW